MDVDAVAVRETEEIGKVVPEVDHLKRNHSLQFQDEHLCVGHHVHLNQQEVDDDLKVFKRVHELT